MQSVHHTVRLSSPKRFGKHVPPSSLGMALQQVETGVKRSVLMAFEGRSVATGRPRAWFNSACDVRFLGMDGDEETLLHFEAPTFGEAASELYRQTELWAARPPPQWTGFDALAGVLQDVRAGNQDSERFDRQLLQTIAHFRRLLEGDFDRVGIEEHRTGKPGEAVLDHTTVEIARRLSEATPKNRPVRVVGRLDMLRLSTQSFAIHLDDGNEVRGVLTDGNASGLRALVNERVLVLGRAVYRPSGRVLRLDADSVEPGAGLPSIWSKVPGPLVRPVHAASDYRKPQTSTSGVNAFFGKWPGPESDEELIALLDEMS
ncbi:MAG: hypothetical protein ABI134_14485 [Byssovorax sp.]